MRILDAKYRKADLQSVVRDNCKHLSANQQTKLLQLLKKYESLFDCTLDDWKTQLMQAKWLDQHFNWLRLGVQFPWNSKAGVGASRQSR